MLLIGSKAVLQLFFGDITNMSLTSTVSTNNGSAAYSEVDLDLTR